VEVPARHRILDLTDSLQNNVNRNVTTNVKTADNRVTTVLPRGPAPGYACLSSVSSFDLSGTESTSYVVFVKVNDPAQGASDIWTTSDLRVVAPSPSARPSFPSNRKTGAIAGAIGGFVVILLVLLGWMWDRRRTVAASGHDREAHIADSQPSFVAAPVSVSSALPSVSTLRQIPVT
jgi:hypothetical protein